MKKSIILSALYLASLSVFAQSWSLAWKDEFKRDGVPNNNYWSFFQNKPSNDGETSYVQGSLLNSRVSDDHLYLQIRNDIEPNIPFRSAKMQTKNKISFQEGRIEIKAKVPKDVNIISAIGLISIHDESASLADYGEIEISNEVEHGKGKLSATIYIGGSNQHLGNDHPHIVEMPYLNYHIYAFEWDEESIKMLFEDQIVYQHQRNGEDWPFVKPMYFFIKLEIADENFSTHRLDENFHQQLVIDYVRYFRKHEKDLSVQK